MVNVFIYSVGDIEKEEIDKYFPLEFHWESPLISSKVKKEKFNKKVEKFILKRGKQIAKKRNIVNDICAIVTYTNFTKIFSNRGHNYVTVDFYESNQRYINPQS